MVWHQLRTARCSAGLLLAVSTVGVAHAADMPVKANPVSRVYDWSGFYVGANAGYGFGANPVVQSFASASDGTNQPSLSPAGWFGGVQAGYNFQMSNLVVGIEGDFQAGAQRDSICFDFCGVLTFQDSQRLPWFATVRGRLGYAAGPVLFYATGGAAFTKVETSLSGFDGMTPKTTSGNFSDSKSGWTIGGGVEAALWGNWTAKAEYLYLDFGHVTHAIPDTGNGQPVTFGNPVRDHIVRAGLNYRFGGGGFNGESQLAPAWSTASIYSWRGFYIGGHAGYGVERSPGAFIGDGATSDEFSSAPRSVLGGVQGGFNWQSERWVLGVEADYQFAKQNDKLCVAFCLPDQTVNAEHNLQWFSTLRGRVGYTTGPALFYATGGLAVTQVKSSLSAVDFSPVFANDYKDNLTGYAVGGGIETALGGNWSAKVEYLYMDFGSISHGVVVPGPDGGEFAFALRVRDNIARAGINYRFD